MSKDVSDIIDEFTTFLGLNKWRGGKTTDLYGCVIVNFNELSENVKELLLKNSDNALESMNQQLRQHCFNSSIFPQYTTLRIENIPSIKFRELGSQHLNKLISIRGIVNRVVPIQPMVMKASFQCKRCNNIIYIDQKTTFIQYPAKCPQQTCKKFFTNFEFMDAQSTYIDSQELSIQESPEELPAGQIPRKLDILLKNDLVDAVRAGDIITISGILRVNQKTEKIKKRTFETILDVNYVRVESKEALELVLTDSDIEEIKQVGADPNIHNRLVQEFIPSIYGNEHIKEGIIYLIFGGVRRERPDSVTRGEINILLIGDPACAKSQLLKGTIKYVPRGLYTTGMGSSGVGLTAAVIKQENEGYALEAGALVLGDKGIVCIDEMDKMAEEERSKVHEAMEQHTVSISKAGINTTLNARCAILGAANPAFGRYDNFKTLAENLSNFPVTLLTRFDLIFIIKDKVDNIEDKFMAEHILKSRNIIHKELSPEFFKKYIAYARRINPNLTDEAYEILLNFYLNLRKESGVKIDDNNEMNPIMITPRQLEGLIRLSEAHSRIALIENIRKEDAEAAIRIMTQSLSECGINPKTGKVDIDIISTGKTKKSEDEKDKEQKALNVLARFNNEIKEDDWKTILVTEEKLTFEEAGKAIGRLVKDNRVYCHDFLSKLYKLTKCG